MLRDGAFLNDYSHTPLRPSRSFILYLSTGRMGRIIMCSPEGRVKLQSIHHVNLTLYCTFQAPLPVSSLPLHFAYLDPVQRPNPCMIGPCLLNMYSFHVHSRRLLVSQILTLITSIVLVYTCTVEPFFVLICLNLFPCFLFCCTRRRKEFHEELVHT